ncbi:hypothetical protein [Natronobiforma cellulositropha]|uniref:hypothetical protein n=1 Tax=Natronobiforma cellulositropha TaxID=1679076 RepID=UPI0021D5E4DB|nr:hypothetical protein [Natronobiforma cellulositropha]
MATSDKILKEKPPEFYNLLAECINVAEHRGLIHYEDAAEIVGVIPLKTNSWAAAISKEVTQHGHPMLSALIVNKNTKVPGDGFYTLAHNLDPERFSQHPDELTDREKIQLWEAELERIYDTFAN